MLTLWCKGWSLATTKTCFKLDLKKPSKLVQQPIYKALIQLFRAIVELSFDVIFNRGCY